MKKILSAILIMSLIAGSIVSGLRLSLRSASADSPSGDLYLDQVESLLLHYEPANYQEIEEFFDLCNEKLSLENTNYFVFAIEDYDSTGWMITLYQNSPNQGSTWYSYASNNLSGLSTLESPGNNPYNSAIVVASLMSVGSSINIKYPSNLSLQFSRAHTFTSSVLNGSTGWRCACPTSYNFAVEGRFCFSSIDILNGSGGWSMSKNLFPGAEPDPQFDFEIIVFWIGTRRYLTTVDQSLIRSLNGSELLEYILDVQYVLDDDSELTATYEYDNVVLIQYPGDIAYLLENMSPLGLYAIDITNHPAVSISAAFLYDEFTIAESMVGICTNVPYVLQNEAPEPGTDGTPDSYTQAWSVYNEYVSNYNTTSIVPESLSDRIFSTSGAKTLPAEILIPDSLVTTSGTAVVNPVFLWSFGSQVDWDVSVIDYSLCDVCIIPYNQTSYAMKFWYGSGVAQQFSSIDTFEFDRILDMYDVILIVNSYPDFLFDSGVPGPASIYSRGFTGTSSDMQYVDAIEIGTLNDQRFNCFAIVTERCLQKTQLYNFSDGISKIYDLMCDYIRSEDDWKASFLLWSSAMFSSVDSLNGKLDAINSSIKAIDIEGIIHRLDQIANNTSETETNLWYEPLFWFVDQFKPALSDFTNSIDAIDSSWETMPLLPELSPVPTIPLIGGS